MYQKARNHYYYLFLIYNNVLQNLIIYFICGKSLLLISSKLILNGVFDYPDLLNFIYFWQKIQKFFVLDIHNHLKLNVT